MSGLSNWKGKNCCVIVRRVDYNAFTAVPVTDVSDSHISLVDKYGHSYTFNVEEVVRIKELEE